MNVSTYELARIALIIQDRHRDFDRSQALQAAFVLLTDAQVCIENNLAGKAAPDPIAERAFKERVEENLKIMNQAIGTVRVPPNPAA